MPLFPIEYKIKGVTLNVHDMYNICEYYQAACTAEYIFENYNVTEEEAMNFGIEVRRKMDKNECSEEDAIYEVMCNKSRRNY